MGFELPPGTVVAAQAWSMHRNETIFPFPDTFSPERWLETDQPGSAERLARMQQNMMPFGTGSRVCGGQNLAQIMLKVMVVAMARNFDVVAPAETNEKSMEIKDSFVSAFYISLFITNFYSGYLPLRYGVQTYISPSFPVNGIPSSLLSPFQSAFLFGYFIPLSYLLVDHCVLDRRSCFLSLFAILCVIPFAIPFVIIILWHSVRIRLCYRLFYFVLTND